MLIQKLCFFCLLILTFSFLIPATTNATTHNSLHQQTTGADFPTVDPNYIYDQLAYMVTNYQHREAGYDNNLPVNVNGHDEFATYWAQEMQRDLTGFGPYVSRDPFAVQGWQGRPATVPAFNVEVTVPGVSHPEQVVVIGCHYDGEASSTQSANDDASGCAIELGVAKALGTYWRSHQLYPARTLRFVIFDAEEQGLFGSFHYLNSTINGDVKNLVAMFNEEQNGIAYPLRYLGQLSNPLLPFYIDMSPLQNNQLYTHQGQLSLQQKDAIAHFRALMQQAVIASFAQFQKMGYQMLSYHNSNQQDVFEPIFTSDQVKNIQQEDDTLGGSDQIPFTLAGLPCATFVGNSSYYDQNPPPWSYPFDQPQDTIQLMNTFADGSSQKSYALVMALGLPGMLTTWMLNQPEILGQSSAIQSPIAAISDVGQTVVNRSINLNARASYNPTGNALTYTWDFGDGTQANGIAISHTYTRTGSYTLQLTVSSTDGTRTIRKVIDVVTQPISYNNPYAHDQQDGVPPVNPAVTLPTPNDQLSDKVTTTAGATVAALTPASSISNFSIGWIIGGLILAVLLIGGIAVVLWRRRQTNV
ncbi:MAG TPA: M28 family peptidase [Ktedonobacteraceae bacterium]|nr:M28 family peptidase [Ktedonobacteraceae bacterium]